VKELTKYECETCHEVYDDYHRCQHCEAAHIQFETLVIVRGVHSRAQPVVPDEGQWPTSIIVGINNNRETLARYKYESVEEHLCGDPWVVDQYYATGRN
jgi:hypothetical protein